MTPAGLFPQRQQAVHFLRNLTGALVQLLSRVTQILLEHLDGADLVMQLCRPTHQADDACLFVLDGAAFLVQFMLSIAIRSLCFAQPRLGLLL